MRQDTAMFMQPITYKRAGSDLTRTVQGDMSHSSKESACLAMTGAPGAIASIHAAVQLGWPINLAALQRDYCTGVVLQQRRHSLHLVLHEVNNAGQSTSTY